MRVAVVHYSAPPAIGGVETVIGAHARLYQAAGHEVRMIATSGRCDWLLRAGASLPEVAVSLDGCDLVIVHNVMTMPFDMPLTEALWELATIPSQRRWIAWVHDLASENADYIGRYSGEPAWVRLTTTHPRIEYIAVSEARCEQFRSRTGGTCRVVPNGVDAPAVLGLTPAVRELGEMHALLPREIVLLHPARMLPRKNIELTLEVTAALRKSGRDAACVITGAPDPHNRTMVDYVSKLEKLRKSSGLMEHAVFVHAHFPAADSDMAALYRLADAVVFPSKQEGFGLPVLESGLHGVPIFCPHQAPLNTLLAAGVHYFRRDASAAEIATLIAEHLQASPRWQARKEVVRRYSWEAIYQNHLAALLR